MVNIDALQGAGADFGKLEVKSAQGDKLGKVDGFVVDADSGRPYYVCVDAGGWFKSKHYLLPIGHAQLDTNADAIVTDLTRDHVKRFPGFDKDEFASLSEADLKRLNDDTCAVCCVTDVTISAWERPHYQYPSWWDASYYRPDRAGEKSVTAGAEWSGGERPAAAAADRRRS
jgi:hypothetical protein